MSSLQRALSTPLPVRADFYSKVRSRIAKTEAHINHLQLKLAELYRTLQTGPKPRASRKGIPLSEQTRVRMALGRQARRDAISSMGRERGLDFLAEQRAKASREARASRGPKLSATEAANLRAAGYRTARKGMLASKFSNYQFIM